MNTRHMAAVLGSLMVLVCLGACSGSDPVRPVQDPDVLLTVQFESYPSVERPREGFVFISDQDGHILDCAPWTTTSKVVLRNTEAHPETISFTMFESSATRPAFTTKFAVPAGSVLKFPEHPNSAQTGVARIYLRNAPSAQRFTMSANHRTYLGQLSAFRQIDLDVVGETTDLYAMVVPEVGTPVGGWLRGLRAGDRDTVDFDSTRDVAPLERVSFEIPVGAEWVICRARAKSPNSLPGGLLAMDNVAIRGKGPDSLSLYLPGIEPEDMVLEFYQEFAEETGTFYWQEIHGQLPSNIANLEGDLAVISASPDSVAIRASFAWDRFLTSWRQEKDMLVSWLTEGPASSEGLGLPEIPPEVAEVIPEFAREGFTISIVEVYQETSGGIVRSQGMDFRADKTNSEEEPMRPGLRSLR